MVLVLNTASAIISFTKKLEECSARIYEDLAENTDDTKKRDFFLSLASESRKNSAIVEEAYYGVISDQVESSFFEPLNSEEYEIDVKESRDLEGIIEIEDRIQGFYIDAANLLRPFLPDVSNAFKRVTKRRKKRWERLSEAMSDG